MRKAGLFRFLLIAPIVIALTLFAMPSFAKAEKICPKCGKLYSNNSYTYCMEDGTKLKKVVKRGQVKPKKRTAGKKVQSSPKKRIAKQEGREQYQPELVSTAQDQDGGNRFIAYDNGTVLDTKTNLMWAAANNWKNVDWAQANSYCENYRGGGYTDWRMPTQDELAELYDENKTYSTYCGDAHITPMIRLACSRVWATDWYSNGTAAVFQFRDGKRLRWVPTATANRALPVRYAR